MAKKDRSYATCTRGCVRARSLSRSCRRIALWLNPNVCFAQVRVLECFFEGLEQWPAGCKLFVHVSSVLLMRTQRSRRCLQAPTMARWSCVCSSDGWPQPGRLSALRNKQGVKDKLVSASSRRGIAQQHPYCIASWSKALASQ